MILDQFLNESYGYSNIPDVEASNEGFDFEHGGFHEVIGLAESEMHKMRLAEMAVECKSVQLLAENSMDAFNLLQENVVTSFFAKIKEIVVKLWQRMKEVINTVKMYFQKIVSDKAFLASAKKALEKHADWSGLEYEGFEFTLDAVDPKAIYNDCKDGINNAIETVGVHKELDLLKKNTPTPEEKTKIKKLKEELDKATTDEAIKKIFSTKAMGGKSFSDAKNYFFKKFRNDKDSKNKVSFDKKSALEAIETLNSSINTAKGISADIDSTHKSTLDVIEEKRKEAEKFNNENSGTNYRSEEHTSELQSPDHLVC